MHVLLTGATGFVGARVLDRLVTRGDTVNVVALPETVDDVGHTEKVRIFAGGLDDFDVLEAAMEGVEVIYHVAGVLPSATPRDLARVNVHGTENVLLTAAAARARRVVFTSSTAVYAPVPPRLMPIDEEYPLRQTPQGPIGGYGRSKIAAEEIVERFHRRHRLECAVVRAPMVYGPRARLADPLVRELATRPPAFRPRRASAQMQWVHVSDMVDALILAGTRAGLTLDTFNIAGPETFSVADITDLVHATDGPRGGRWAEHWSSLAPEPPLLYDISHAEEVLGYRPCVTLEEGVRGILQASDNGGPHD